MMKFNLVKSITLIFSLFLVSCQTEDINNFQEESITDFPFPLQTNNYWKYRVYQGTAQNALLDHIAITGDVTINGNSYKKFESVNPTTNGFFSGMMNGKGLRKDVNKHLLTGNFSFPAFGNITINQTISLNDFNILQRNVPSGELSSVSGSFDQTINNVPLKFEYSIKSISSEFFATYSFPANVIPSGQTTFNEVKETDIILNLKITTQQLVGGVPITIVVLQPQNVLVSKLYFAKGIGVAHAKTTTSYSINASIASQLGIPADSNVESNEYLYERN